ncbi:VOC family protein [uncultured Alsobacter sp.]|uniref:VOC family protein n=1 Tax=uncultured Alsobacter sp. TaxID=1748258 RepID=UPI0025E5BA17|nr:VOC family protein [uncultured Alsobacter sp.]
MANPIIWYELLTSDHRAAADFYRVALGWDIAPWQGKAGEGAMPYLMFGGGGAMSGGIMDFPPPALANGAPPHWSAYVMVPDTDAAAQKAASLGGQVMVPPTDIPEVGRFAVITDPQGAFINVMTPLPMDPPPPRPPEGMPGQCGWHELFTTDQAGALSFYGAMFGWSKVRGHDMGPMGVYEILAIDGKETIGTMTLPPHMPRPHWNFYFIVDDIQAAAARTTASGGSVVMGPMEVPGGSWVFQGRDPQGAYFGAVKPAA